LGPDLTSCLKSPQARYAAHAAAAKGYAFRSLDGEDGYLFEVRDGQRRATFAAGSGTPYALNDARAAAVARDKAFCAIVLGAAGLPALPGEMFFVTARWSQMRHPGRELVDAQNYLSHVNFPVFCKPISGSNGLYAEVVASLEEFTAYVGRVSREHFAILVQPYIQAPEYRVFVLNDRALFSYRKRLPSVVGDGRRTLRELMAMAAAPDQPAIANVRARDQAGRLFDPDRAPEKGARIVLEGPANRAAGGGAEALREGASDALANLARAAAGAIGLRLAAIDVFELSAGALTVIEVNSNPMIATLEEAGRWDLIDAIWTANIEAALR